MGETNCFLCREGEQLGGTSINLFLSSVSGRGTVVGNKGRTATQDQFGHIFYTKQQFILSGARHKRKFGVILTLRVLAQLHLIIGVILTVRVLVQLHLIIGVILTLRVLVHLHLIVAFLQPFTPPLEQHLPPLPAGAEQTQSPPLQRGLILFLHIKVMCFICCFLVVVGWVGMSRLAIKVVTTCWNGRIHVHNR